MGVSLLEALDPQPVKSREVVQEVDAHVAVLVVVGVSGRLEFQADDLPASSAPVRPAIEAERYSHREDLRLRSSG